MFSHFSALLSLPRRALCGGVVAGGGVKLLGDKIDVSPLSYAALLDNFSPPFLRKLFPRLCRVCRQEKVYPRRHLPKAGAESRGEI